MSARIMAHMVACYPDYDRAVEIGKALLDAGVAYLEVQFPFSDPTADGPVIQTACTEALESGFSVDEGFRLIGELCDYRDSRFADGARAPVFLMSYASLVFARPMAQFVRDAKSAGVVGLIVPDLPVDSDEGLYALGRSQEIDVIPVVVPSMSERRLELLRTVRPRFLYAALRSGITGSYTEIGEENLAFLRRLAPFGAQVLAGFGIRSPEQVALLVPHVHAVIVGSAFVAEIASAGRSPGAAARAVGGRAASLIDA